MSRIFDGLNLESSDIVEAYKQRVLEMVKESAQELEKAQKDLQKVQADEAKAKADMDDAVCVSDMESYADAQTRLAFSKAQVVKLNQRINKLQNCDILSVEEYQRLRNDIKKNYSKEYNQLCMDIIPHLQAILDAQKAFNDKAKYMNVIIEIAMNSLYADKNKGFNTGAIGVFDFPAHIAEKPHLINENSAKLIMDYVKTLDK